MLVDIQKGMRHVGNLKANKIMELLEAERKRYEAAGSLGHAAKEAHYLQKYIQGNPTAFPLALEAVRFYERNRSRPSQLFPPPPQALEQANVPPMTPERTEDIPKDLSETDIMYLRALHDIIEGDSQLVKHYDFLARTWEAQAAEVYAKADGLLFEKEHLKMLSGLRDEDISCLVPPAPAPSQRF
jgi:hypothetical protein